MLHSSPSNPVLHSQLKVLLPSTHTPFPLQFTPTQSLMLVWHRSPVNPGSQLHSLIPVAAFIKHSPFKQPLMVQSLILFTTLQSAPVKPGLQMQSKVLAPGSTTHWPFPLQVTPVHGLTLLTASWHNLPVNPGLQMQRKVLTPSMHIPLPLHVTPMQSLTSVPVPGGACAWTHTCSYACRRRERA